MFCLLPCSLQLFLPLVCLLLQTADLVVGFVDNILHGVQLHSLSQVLAEASLHFILVFYTLCKVRQVTIQEVRYEVMLNIVEGRRSPS